jgi:hypothetical protein
MYAAVRMPMLIGRQVDFQLRRSLLDPQVVTFVQSTTRFSDATSRFADTVARYPQDFSTSTAAAIEQALKGVSTERQAALDQANAAITAQRAAIIKELDAQQSKLRQIVTDVNGVLEHATRAGFSINAATAQTVTTTEQATQRTVDYAFRRAVALALLLMIGIPLSILLLRAAARRLNRPPAASTPSPLT